MDLCITCSCASTMTEFVLTFMCWIFTEYYSSNCGFFLAIAVSRDHKPDQTDERQRIEDAGGFVMWAGNANM